MKLLFNETNPDFSKVANIQIEKIKGIWLVTIQSSGDFATLSCVVSGLSEPIEADEVQNKTLNRDPHNKSALVLTTHISWYIANLFLNKIMSYELVAKISNKLEPVTSESLIRKHGLRDSSKPTMTFSLTAKPKTKIKRKHRNGATSDAIKDSRTPTLTLKA